MNGYIPIRVMIPIGQPNGGTFADLWQKVEDGRQTAVVTDEGIEVQVPEIHEAMARGNQLHFAPGVPNDPAQFQPLRMAEFRAALAAGPEAYAEMIASEQSRFSDHQAKQAKGG